MTTPTSALGMSHIQTEFGGSNPIALSEYYGVHANVATSGTIKMSQFLGISAFLVQVLSRTVSAYGEFATEPGMTFATTGAVTAQDFVWSSISFTNYNWMVGSTSSNFDIKYVKTGGNVASLSAGTNRVSANDTWYNMNTNKILSLYNTVEFTASELIADVSIRWNSNGTIISTASCTWYAECVK